MTLEETKELLLSTGYWEVVRSPELREQFFSIYSALGAPIKKNCPSCWYSKFNELRRLDLTNYKIMSSNKFQFKKGVQFVDRESKQVYTNHNASDERIVSWVAVDPDVKRLLEMDESIEKDLDSAVRKALEKTEGKRQPPKKGSKK